MRFSSVFSFALAMTTTATVHVFAQAYEAAEAIADLKSFEGTIKDCTAKFNEMDLVSGVVEGQDVGQCILDIRDHVELMKTKIFREHSVRFHPSERCQEITSAGSDAFTALATMCDTLVSMHSEIPTVRMYSEQIYENMEELRVSSSQCFQGSNYMMRIHHSCRERMQTMANSVIVEKIPEVTETYKN